MDGARSVDGAGMVVLSLDREKNNPAKYSKSFANSKIEGVVFEVKIRKTPCFCLSGIMEFIAKIKTEGAYRGAYAKSDA